MLEEVADRIRAAPSIGKSEIGALLFWKRLRAATTWVREVMTMQEPGSPGSDTPRAATTLVMISIALGCALEGGSSHSPPLSGGAAVLPLLFVETLDVVSHARHGERHNTHRRCKDNPFVDQ